MLEIVSEKVRQRVPDVMRRLDPRIDEGLGCSAFVLDELPD
jgi:hypothetical protein